MATHQVDRASSAFSIYIIVIVMQYDKYRHGLLVFTLRVKA